MSSTTDQRAAAGAPGPAVQTGVLAALVLLALAHAAANLSGAAAAPAWRLVSNLSLAVASLAVFGLALRAARRGPRRAWGAIGLAYLAVGTAELIRVGYSLAGVDAFPSPADAAYLLYYPLMLAGLLSLPTSRGGRAERVSLALDIAAVVVGGAMLVWYLLLQPGILSSTSPPLTLGLSLAYPLGDAALLICYSLLWLRRPVSMGAESWLLVGASLMVALAGDVTFAALDAAGVYQEGGWPDLIWLVGKLLVAAACLIDRPREAARPGRGPGPVPYLSIAGGYALLIFVAWEQLRTPFGVMLVGAVTLTALLLARQIVAMQENVRLLEERADLAARAREAAEAASRSKSAFLATMSHELRTPLTAILGYSELLLLQAEERGMEPLRADLEQIERSGQQLLDMVNDVLDLNKLESGALVATPQRFDLAAFIADTAVAVGPALRAQNNSLCVECPPDIGEARLDPLLLRQIAMHLLRNAAKFTQSGTVTLRLRREAGCWLVLEVSDTGIGMSPAQLERLFQPFSQAHTGMSRQYGGTGLGLAISQRLCQLMGGQIEVASAVGRGSTFSVRLPAELPQG